METLDIRADIDLSVTSVYDFVMSDILVLALVLVMCVLLFSKEYEKKLFPLVLATSSKLKAAVSKIAVLAVVCYDSVLVIVNVTRYMTIVKDYPVDYMNAPVQTVSALSAYPHNQTLMSYMICLCILKFLGAILLAFAICAVSAACRSDASAMTGAIALFALPVAAIGADIGFVKYVSVFCYTGGNLFMQSGMSV